MRVYISKDYFDIIETLLNDAAKDILTMKPTNLNCIFQLLSALPLKIDISDTEMKKYAKSIFKNSQYVSFKDRIIANAIKNQNLINGHFDNIIDQYNAYYFIPVDNNHNIGLEKGVILKDQNYDGNDFYANCNVTDEIISDDLTIIQNNIPPTNAMLIIDRYVFGHQFATKLPNLISFVNLYNSNMLSIPFHLTIVCSYELNGKFICSPLLVEQALNSLNEIPNINVEIYIQDNLREKDRLIFTNYTKGNIGHPFTDETTVFNQKFLGCDISPERIKINYKNYKKSLLKWENLINQIPEHNGLLRTKWSNRQFSNRIFDNLN